MYEKNDQIVHRRYGAGVVVGERIVDYNGQKRKYISVQLANDQGIVLLPVDQLEESEDIREVEISLELLEQILQNEPQELDDDYRERQPKIRKKIDTRNPRLLIQALRDMSWLEHQDKLTSSDKKLVDRIYTLLSNELSLKRSIGTAKAQQNIRKMVDQAMEKHSETVLVNTS